MVKRLEQIRVWLRHQGSGGAEANARVELERRAAEQMMLTALEGRVLPVSAPAPIAA